MENARPHGIAEGPPDGHGQTQQRLAKAAKRLARSLSLGAMNLDVEGAGQHKTVGVRLPCTPSHDGCNHDEGLQCPANPVPATVLAGGVFDLFPDFRGEKLTHRTRERLRTLGSPLCLFGRCPRGGSRRLCWGSARGHKTVSYFMPFLKEGRLEALKNKYKHKPHKFVVVWGGEGKQGVTVQSPPWPSNCGAGRPDRWATIVRYR